MNRKARIGLAAAIVVVMVAAILLLIRKLKGSNQDTGGITHLLPNLVARLKNAFRKGEPGVPSSPLDDLKAAGKPGAPLVGQAIFWAHKTDAGFECLGWCDNVAVVTIGDNTGYYLQNSVILDLSQTEGFIVQPEIWLTIPELHQVPGLSGGFHFLHQLINRGFLGSLAAAYLWPSKEDLTSAQIRAKIKKEADRRHREGASWNWQTILSKIPGFVVDFVQDGPSAAIKNIFKRGAAGAITFPRATSGYHVVRSVPWNNFWSGSAWPVGIELSPEAMQFPIGER